MPEKSVTVIPATMPRFSAQRTAGGAKKKVAAYARVSTENEEQATSYEAQIDYYTKLIASRADWTYVDVYSDEGISGTSMKHRDGFNRMIKDALDGKIDLILTKSISRFARNTVDTLTTVRKLKEKGIEVFFEKENIYTLDSKGELLITIMSSIAQEESRSISENVTWGKRKQFSDGRFILPYKRFLGYEKGEDGFPKIVEKEAAIVRRIYQLYLEGATAATVARILTEDGVAPPGHDGTRWYRSTVNSILKNEKYKGDALLQKYYTVDFLTKKRKTNNGEVAQFYVTGSHAPIISPEVFDLVQFEIDRRKHCGQKYGSMHLFSSRIVCGECGGYFGPKVWHSNSKYRTVVWRCNKKYKNADGSAGCHTPHLTDEEIKQAFVGAFNACIKNKKEIVAVCKESLCTVCDTKTLETEMDALQDECAVVAELVRKCIDENAHGTVKPAEYERKYRSLAERYESAKAKICELENELSVKRSKQHSIEVFLREFSKRDGFLSEFDEGLWGIMVDTVTVYSKERLIFKFRNSSLIEWNAD